MKYKCDMIKDLMPLCLDKAATGASEQTVIEHLAECKSCEEYYKMLEKEVRVEGVKASEKNYVDLAKKVRKKKRLFWNVLCIIAVLTYGFVLLCMNYAGGYRFTPKAAAETCGRLNYDAKLIATYEWREDVHFYIYDCYSYYDVVDVSKSWRGWSCSDHRLNWPKWSIYGKNVEIEVAGAVCHFRYDEGVQLFPVIVHDENVKTIEVTCFGETQKKPVVLDEVMLFAFLTDSESFSGNEIEAAAYDADGTLLYRLSPEEGFWEWISVTE